MSCLPCLGELIKYVMRQTLKNKRGHLLLAALLFLTSVGIKGERVLSGSLLVLNKSDGTASVLDLVTGEVTATLGTGIGPHEVAVSPDGRLAVVSNYGEEKVNSLTVLHLERVLPLRTIYLESLAAPHGIVFMPDGKKVAVTAEGSNAVVVVQVETGKIEKIIPTGDNPCHMMALSSDGRTAYASSIVKGTVCVLDLDAGEMTKILHTGKGAEGLAVSPNGEQVWVCNREDDTVSVIDTHSLSVVQTIPVVSFPIRIQFTPDGLSAIVTCARSGEVVALDAKTGEEKRRLSMEIKEEDIRRRYNPYGVSPTPIGLAISLDGQFAFVALTRTDMITVIDLRTWTVLLRLTAGRGPNALVYLGSGL